MKQPEKFHRALNYAITFSLALVLLVSITGYMAYTNETKDMITLNLPAGWISMLALILFCVAIPATIPLYLKPL